MAYSEFTIDNVASRLNLRLLPTTILFPSITPMSPSEFLQTALAEGFPLASLISTEKARSELIVTPILLEARRRANQPVSFFSGAEFNIAKELGLNGTCDFILTLSGVQYTIEAPIVTIDEAKNDNIRSGLGQCIAEMHAAQLFNEARQTSFPFIYGAVTTGVDWRFIRLQGKDVQIDDHDYNILQLDRLLGVLNFILNTPTLHH
jgi:hypothetical protein